MTKAEDELTKMADDMKDMLVETGKVAPNLSDVPGVGPRILWRLFKAGIATLEVLSAQNPIDLATAIDVTDDVAVRLVKAARELKKAGGY